VYLLRRALKVRPGEEAVALRLFLLMLVVWAGTAVGATGVESLLFARFGPSVLPVLYIVVGPVTLVVMLGMGVFLGRPRPGGVLSMVPLLVAAVLLPARLALVIDQAWLYPILWLLMMVLWTVEAMSMWALAGTVHDTRQAKRLFPLYGAGMILGSALGGLATRPLVAWLHAENLLLLWAGAMVATFAIARTVVGGTARGRRRRRRSRTERRSPLAEMREGIRFARRSPLLRAMAGALTSFGLLYFMITLPFAEAATERFPQPDQLAGFLGLFYGLANLGALLLSLIVANRLFARFGVAGMILVLPAIYAVGFAIMGLAPSFAALLGFRFLQLTWVYGVWAPGWQALFNVIPEARRGQARTFMDGGPLQAGTVLGGLVLLAADRLLEPRALFLVGAAAGIAAVVASWALRERYRDAVVEALRAGWPEVFLAEEEPFGGFLADGAAVKALVAATSDPDPRVRRAALEILADVQEEEAAETLAAAAASEDPEIRAVALDAAARRRIPIGLDVLAVSLVDPDPVVRARAVDAAGIGDAAPEELAVHLSARLSDPHPEVRARAAAVLARMGEPGRGLQVLRTMRGDARPSWRVASLDALGEVGGATDVVPPSLGDPEASVRRAAVRALGRLDGGDAVAPLVAALGDEDASVREEAAASLARIEDGVADRLVEALADPRLQAGAVLALRRLPGPPPPALHAHAVAQAAIAARYHGLWADLDDHGDGRVGLLATAVRDRVLHHASQALMALAPFDDPEAIDLALDNLASRDLEQRANALETLEAVGEPEIIRPLLVLWEGTERSSRDGASAVVELLRDEDAWLRACAAFAATGLSDARVEAAVEAAAASDTDTLVRETAARTLKGDIGVETLPTLPVMERILALRKVPLFRQLSPVDLKHVADVATEHVYHDGTVIAEEGDPGDAMHVVVTGEVRVLLGQGDGSVEVARRTEGYIVGEMAILTQEPRMASLVASEEVRTLSIDRKRFERILRERPDVSLAVMRELCFRLQEAHGGTRSEPHSR
jgi:HEAT repeat protein